MGLPYERVGRCVGRLVLAGGLAAGAQAQATGPAQGRLEAVQGPPVTAYTLPPAKLQQAHALYRIDVGLQLAAFAWGVVVLLAVLGMRVGPRLRRFAEHHARGRFAQAWLFAVPLLLLLDVLELPVGAYGHGVALRYGLSVQGWGSWLWDWAKAEGIGLAIGAMLVWIFYAVVRRSPRRWWQWFWAALAPLVVLGTFLTPLVFDPLFHRFVPLAPRHPALAAELERVARHGGLDIPTGRMYEMIASGKTTTLNAYVTGLGASDRIVVWDTTIQKLTTPEILSVFGHEMGHYVLHHVLLGVVLACGGLLAGLGVAGRALPWFVQTVGGRWGILGLSDWASLPLVLLVLAVAGFLSEPVDNAISRRLEHQADVYGLEVIHGLVPDAAQVTARSFQTLGEISLDYPYPGWLAVFWFYTHPPIADRIRFALTYDPWRDGREPRYVREPGPRH